MQNVTENLKLSGDLDLPHVLNKPVQTLRSKHHVKHHCFSMQHLTYNYHREPHSILFFSCNWHNTSLPLLHLHAFQEIFQIQGSLSLFSQMLCCTNYVFPRAENHKAILYKLMLTWSIAVSTALKKKLGNSKNSTLRIWGIATHIWGLLGRYFNLFS